MSLIGKMLSASVAISDFRRPQNWLLNYFSRGSASGTEVTGDRALGLSGFWHASRSIAEDIGKIPLVTYRRLERGKEEAEDHPVFSLLHDVPNPNMTAMSLKETMTHQALIAGNAFAEIQFSNSTGEIVGLWPIHPSRVEIRPNRNNTRALVYVIYNDDGTITPREPRRILHLHGLGMDGVQGYSIIKIALESIGLGLAVETFGSSFFGNGAHLRGAVKHPGQLSDKALEHLRDSWSETYQGPENAHKFAIFEEGMDWVRMGIEPEAAQFLQTREFTVEEMARFFRMPVQKMGIMLAKGTSGQKMTDEDVQSLYVTDTLMPWMVRFEQECKRKLFAFSSDRRHFAKFFISGMLRGSAEARSNYWSRLFHVGAASQNDIREAEGLNPVPHGDVLYVPVNMVPAHLAATGQLGGAPAPNQPEGDQTQTDDKREEAERENDQGAPSRRQGGRQSAGIDAMAPVITEAFARLFKREQMAIGKAAKKHAENVDGYIAWLDEFIEAQADIGEELLLAPRITMTEVWGVDIEGRPVALSNAIEESRQMAMELYRDDPLAVAGRWATLNDGREEAYAMSFLDQYRGHAAALEISELEEATA